MKPSREILEKFDTTTLINILNDYFTEGIYRNFFMEFCDEEKIENTDTFLRDFIIRNIMEDVSFEDLVESGWCFEDEMDED